MAVGDEKDGSAVAANGSRTSRSSSGLEEIEKDNEKTQMGQAPVAGMGLGMDPTGGLKEMDALRKVVIGQN
jgi:hypothetical protein